MVKVAGELRRLQRPSERHHSEALDQHDAGARIDESVARRRVFLEVRALALLEAGDTIDESLLQCLLVLRAGVEVDPERTALGVYEVIRAGSSDLRQLCGALARDERHDRGRDVDLCHARPIHRHCAAKARKHTREEDIACA